MNGFLAVLTAAAQVCGFRWEVKGGKKRNPLLPLPFRIIDVGGTTTMNAGSL